MSVASLRQRTTDLLAQPTRPDDLAGEVGHSGERDATRAPLGRLAGWFLGSRLLILAVAWLSMGVVNKGEFFKPVEEMKDWFFRWDATWYLSIVLHGYQYFPGQQSNVNFFPLYPLLVHLATLGGRVDPKLAGYAVSNLALFGACVLLWKLARRDHGAAAADRTVLFLLLGPVSFFFSILYSEGLFLLMIVGALYFAGSRRWLLAGAFAYGTALTRHVGLLLVLPLLLEGLRARWSHPRAWDWPVLRRPAFLACLVMPAAGLATHCAFLWSRFREPFAFQKSSILWGRWLAPPWDAFTNPDTVAMSDFYKEFFIGAILLAALLILSSFTVARQRWSLLVLAPMYGTLYLCTNQIEAIPRYLSVLFPLYLVVGILCARWPRLEPMLLAASTALLALSVTLFVNGYWFT